MFGHQRWVTADASVVSGATFGGAVEIAGATAIFVQLATFATAADFTVCVGNTASTAQILPLHYFSSAVMNPVKISTASSACIINVSQAAGYKYMKIQASIAMVDGATVKVITAR